MAKCILGLEINDSNIKLLECRQKETQLIIEKSQIISTPKGTVCDGIINDVQQVYEAIYREIKKEGYKSRNMVVVIKSSEIITRDIQMDTMAKRDMDGILALQYEEYLLVDISQYQVTYKVVKKGIEDDRKKQELLIVAAPNIIIFPLLEVASKLKMRVRSINIASDAITSIFFKGNPITNIEDVEVMVVDIEDKSTTVTIVVRGIGVLNRHIPLGLDSLDINSIIEPTIECQLVSEIRRFLQFYFARSKNNSIGKIYISGRGAYIKDIDKYMTKVLNVQCISGIQLNSNQVKFNKKFEGESACFVNILGLVSEF